MKKSNKVKIWIVLGGVIILLIVALGYVFRTGRLHFKADETPIIDNIVEGTYSSEAGNGQINSNTATIEIK